MSSAEGRKGGEFYTPRCVVRLLVEMIEPYKGRVYDPCCGSSGMFLQSEEFIRSMVAVSVIFQYMDRSQTPRLGAWLK